jgi:hypothetical protein
MLQDPVVNIYQQWKEFEDHICVLPCPSVKTICISSLLEHHGPPGDVMTRFTGCVSPLSLDPRCPRTMRITSSSSIFQFES